MLPRQALFGPNDRSTERFIRELSDRYNIDDALFLVDGTDPLQTDSVDSDCDFSMNAAEIETVQNDSFGRLNGEHYVFK